MTIYLGCNYLFLHLALKPCQHSPSTIIQTLTWYLCFYLCHLYHIHSMAARVILLTYEQSHMIFSTPCQWLPISQSRPKSLQQSKMSYVNCTFLPLRFHPTLHVSFSVNLFAGSEISQVIYSSEIFYLP